MQGERSKRFKMVALANGRNGAVSLNGKMNGFTPKTNGIHKNGKSHKVSFFIRDENISDIR